MMHVSDLNILHDGPWTIFRLQGRAAGRKQNVKHLCLGKWTVPVTGPHDLWCLPLQLPTSGSSLQYEVMSPLAVPPTALCVMEQGCWCLEGWWSMANTAATYTSCRSVMSPQGRGLRTPMMHWPRTRHYILTTFNILLCKLIVVCILSNILVSAQCFPRAPLETHHHGNPCQLTSPLPAFTIIPYLAVIVMIMMIIQYILICITKIWYRREAINRQTCIMGYLCRRSIQCFLTKIFTGNTVHPK